MRLNISLDNVLDDVLVLRGRINERSLEDEMAWILSKVTAIM